jgi:EAL domain-containing protein (putative c-di-GMP-specific phosphodiesterase class I)
VHDLGEDGRGDDAIVQAIIGMAKALGMHVILRASRRRAGSRA